MKGYERIRNWATVSVAAAGFVFASAGPAAAAPVPPAPLLPLFNIVRGTATVCLAPQAHVALANTNMQLSAGEPAWLVTDRATPCVSTTATEGTVSLDLLGGEFSFPGSLVLTRDDGTTATLTDLTIQFGVLGQLRGRVQGRTLEPITLATFMVDPLKISTNLVSYLEARDAPFVLTDQAAQVLDEIFGAGPWQGGDTILIGEGSGTIRPTGLLALLAY